MHGPTTISQQSVAFVVVLADKEEGMPKWYKPGATIEVTRRARVDEAAGVVVATP